jgi:hypothetical protein
MKRIVATLGCALALGVTPIFAQDKPADNMQILREKVRADKKLVVAANMDLTESEARGFWPVYEAYQRDLEKLNQRLGAVITSYAADYRADSLTDDKARALIQEAIAIEEAEARLKWAGRRPLTLPETPAVSILREIRGWTRR